MVVMLCSLFNDVGIICKNNQTVVLVINNCM